MVVSNLGRVVFLLILNIIIAEGRVEISDFFPFGTTDDILLPANDDSSSPQVPLLLPFNFFAATHTSLWVNNNGGVSFLRAVSTFTPSCTPQSQTNKMITPFWADVDTRNGLGNVTYRQTTSDARVFAKAKAEIAAAFTDFQNIQLSWALIVTWNEVGRYRMNGTVRNTFQLTLASDTLRSFAIFYYNKIEWTVGDASGTTHARVGFDAGDGVSNHIFMFPTSCTSEIANVIFDSNVNQPGKFVFRVDESRVTGAGCRTDWPTTDALSPIPPHVSAYGNEIVQFKGPCFSTTSSITCTFVDLSKGPISVRGQVVDETVVSCQTPFFHKYGRISVQIKQTSVGGSAVTYSSNLFVISQPRGILLNAQVSSAVSSILRLSWNTGFFSQQNLKLYIHYLNSSIDWEDPAELSVTVPNYGTFQLSRDMLANAVGNRRNQIATFSLCHGNSGTRNAHSCLITDLPFAISALATGGLSNPICTINDPPPSDLIPCPPLLEQARQDPRFVRSDDALWLFHPGADTCYRSVTPSPSGGGQQCCYKFTNGQPTVGTILCGPPGGGTADKYSPREFVTKHFLYDVLPWIGCCLISGFSSASCTQYYRYRPSQCGDGYVPPRLTQGNGDPHFVTFDGFAYTFNGHGEYWLMDSTCCDVQVRMIPLVSSASASQTFPAGKGPSMAGAISPQTATVISAVVAKSGSDKFQVQISPQQAYLEMYLNGDSFFFPNTITTITVGSITVSRTPTDNNVVTLVFNGLTFIIKLQQGALAVTGAGCNPPVQGAFQGLLGDCDGNNANDLRVPVTGTILPPNSSPQTIHSQFGEKWRVTTAGASYFTYRTGESFQTFYHPEYTPTFDQPDPSTFTQAVRNICGTSTACYYDFHVTGSVDFANLTRATRAEYQNTLNALAAQVPMCPALPTSVQDGRMAFANNKAYMVGSEVQYTCNSNYVLRGTSKLVCGSNRQWSAAVPGCYMGESGGGSSGVGPSIGVASSIFLGATILAILWSMASASSMCHVMY